MPRFVIIGVGGTGGWLTMGLAATIEHSDIDPKVLVLVDGDSFEPKNQERQHFMNLGNKAAVRAAEVQPMYPKTVILPDERWVVDEIPKDKEETTKVVTAGPTKTSKEHLLQEDDWVFLCVDNFKCRADVVAAAQHFKNLNIFLVGNDEEYFGSVYHYERRDGKDITWDPLSFKDELANPPDRNPGAMSCQERAAIEGGTQFIWTNMAVAAWVGSLVNRLIFRPDKSEAAQWDELMFDLRDGSASTSVRRDETPEEGEKVLTDVGAVEEAVPAS